MIDDKKEEEDKRLRRIEEEGKIKQPSRELQRSSRVSVDQSKGEQKFKLPKLVISPFTGTHIVEAAT